ncbi:Similar to Aggf1: Angiogenic factor with G patch and FHA domains 1 (Mus musculus) [Cotesia congregata]|uniref:Similar to Aggf1: Angiogenic factor with G patch and FHA domains 1 (Mus musculus) n=1 Tax=Cotesia congregata TaxID=51543 RepID=A0A8J2MIR7_COTCN|nr:Similar to Aggf1: Angiogenic factor with G patch and FHA domains 1 (Mus musculus) [Cotesia congregata]
MNSNECEEYSENEDDNKFNIKINISEDFDELLKDFPEVLEFITKLKKYIKYQDKKITKLHNKLMNQKKGRKFGKEFLDKEVQTDFGDKLSGEGVAEWSESNISEQVKQVAESTLQQSGFVYEETSGLYYDYNTGYYYDAAKGLYYDGNSGIYYYYDNETKSYKYHSQLSTAEVPDTKKKEKRKKNKKHKDVAKKSRDTPMDEVVEEGECSASETSSSTESSSESTDNDGKCCKKLPTMHADNRQGNKSSASQYELIDLGSRNGTYVNGKRVSVAKQESEPVEIAHGSIVQVASTKLLCHVHNGHETCGHCEPGLIQQPVDESGNSRKVHSHKSELKRLKNKFGVDKDNTDKASQVARGYQDRAQARREKVGSSNQYAKTQQSSVDTSIAKDNKGFKLLSKMGWSEGQSLGKDGDGRTEPVQMVNNNAKKGLGNTDLPSIEMDASVEKKQAIWRKTRQRYDQT